MTKIVLILKAIALGMGISVFVLNILHELSVETAISLLAIGVTCLAIAYLRDKRED